MNKQDFYYVLPPHLIVQHPSSKRTDSRLLVLDKGNIQHSNFTQFETLINPEDLLVFNNTKVIPARIYGSKSTGGKVEILVERCLDATHCLAHIRASKSPKLGSTLNLEGNIQVEVIGRNGDLFKLQCLNHNDLAQQLEQHGHMPLPPYITRDDELSDKDRYQTVYAKHKGAVAAPTAGLHFDQLTLDKLQNKGVEFAFVTLHVGAGTFQPVRVDDIKQHHMHAEWIEVTAQVCNQIDQTKAKGGRVIAIGTTSVRCLETASRNGVIEPYQGDTDIFIYPGFNFHSVDAMLTNFHLPESTLLMLVSAFAGMENIRNAYQAAIEQQYRFFSYGDAMFLTRQQEEHAI